MTQCCFSNQRGKSSSCFFSSGLKPVNRLLIYLLFTVIFNCPSGRFIRVQHLERFHFSSRQKDHKEPAIRTSEPIKFYYSFQSNQSYLSKIKTLKIQVFLFQLPPTFFFFFKLNGQNKFILCSENILKKISISPSNIRILFEYPHEYSNINVGIR